jgi:hypothetical protein
VPSAMVSAMPPHNRMIVGVRQLFEIDESTV